MILTNKEFNRLNDDDKNFIIHRGAFNCKVVKFKPEFYLDLAVYFKKRNDYYTESEYTELRSLDDGKWHLVHFDSDGDLFVSTDSNGFVIKPWCITSEGNISQYLNQK